MSDYLFGVLCGGSFMLPGFALGYAAAMKRGWKREDELRERLEKCQDWRTNDFTRTHDALGRQILPPGAG